VSTSHVEGPGDCESAVFTAVEVDGVGDKELRDIIIVYVRILLEDLKNICNYFPQLPIYQSF
jgi:hypothetical protein